MGSDAAVVDPSAPATARDWPEPSARSNGTPQKDCEPKGSRVISFAVAGAQGEASAVEWVRIGASESGVDFDIWWVSGRFGFAPDGRARSSAVHDRSTLARLGAGPGDGVSAEVLI